MGVKFVSLFSGGMGLDLGLEMAGFETAVYVEKDLEAVQTIKLNRPSLPGLNDITQVTGDALRRLGKLDGEIALVAGGPPCQAFSVFGKRAGIDDVRGQLIFDFVRLIDELRPHVFIMENVRGLLSMPVIPRSKHHDEEQKHPPEFYTHGSLLRLVLSEFEKIGYRIDCYVVNAVNYGAPQIRERLICIGNRHNLLADFPPPRYSNRPEDELGIDADKEHAQQEVPSQRIIHLRPHVRTRSFWKNGRVYAGDVSYYDEGENEETCVDTDSACQLRLALAVS